MEIKEEIKQIKIAIKISSPKTIRNFKLNEIKNK